MRIPVLLASVVLLAAPEAHAAGGVLFGLEYGFGSWSLDASHLSSQLPKPTKDDPVDLGPTLVNGVQTGQAVGLRLGYNILGHATVEGIVSATGWNLTDITRGGGGFLGGEATWHPLQIWIPENERKYDAELMLGYEYGLMGQLLGMGGNALSWGLRGQYFLGKVFFVGATFRMHHLLFDKFYRNYDQRDVEGNTLDLSDGSGGTFYTLGLNIGFQVDVLE